MIAVPNRAQNREIEAVVIGGSAGVLDVLRAILAALPQDLRVPIIVVVHLPARAPTALHESLASVSATPMQQVDDKEPLRGGRVYFAAPDYHLLIERDRCAALSLDEPVLYSRPSIDVLFQSASEAYGAGLLSILLTGASADGAEGALAVHSAGGVTVVQDPATCEAMLMPQSALELFTPDFVLSPTDIAALLGRLVALSPSSMCLS
jgi:two-component system, chemotaxis family, protein-glutamate methylesterase/glutaminase